MVKQIGSVTPRSTQAVELESQLTDDGIIKPAFNEQRHTYRFKSTLDEYVSVSIKGTDSLDNGFDDGVSVNGVVPIPAGTNQEWEYVGAYEYLQFEVTAENAPTEGSLTCVQFQDNGPPTEKTSLITDRDVFEGKTYLVSEHEQIIDGSSTTIGIRNPEGSGFTVVANEIGLIATGNGLVSYEVDHSSYTDGTNVDIVNRRPAYQTEIPAQVSVSLNPTTSGPQQSTNGLIPGGTKGAGSGAVENSSSFVLDEGQDLTITMQNISGGDNRFGWLLGFAEMVI